MVARKPKGIADDIVGGVRNIVSPWLGAPPGQNKSVTKAQGLARSAAETLDQTFAGGMVKAGTQGNKALVKQAAINAAALGVGYVAGKAIQTAAGAVIESGVPARLVNKVTGQKIVVHSSPQKGIKQIEPRLGSNQLPDQNVMFGFDPRKSGMADRITRATGRYVSKQEGQPTGSVYVTSIKKSEIVTPPKLVNTGQVVSRGLGRVVSEIPVSGKTFAQVDAELQRQLRLAGASSKPATSRTADAVEIARSKVSQTFMTKAQKDAARRKRIR